MSLSSSSIPSSPKSSADLRIATFFDFEIISILSTANGFCSVSNRFLILSQSSLSISLETPPRPFYPRAYFDLAILSIFLINSSSFFRRFFSYSLTRYSSSFLASSSIFFNLSLLSLVYFSSSAFLRLSSSFNRLSCSFCSRRFRSLISSFRIACSCFFKSFRNSKQSVLCFLVMASALNSLTFLPASSAS